MNQYSIVLRFAGALLASLSLVAGCKSGEEPTAEVAGAVKNAAGEPVGRGRVNFYAKERGVGGVGELDSEGKFTLDAPIPLGKYIVFIAPPLPEPPQPGKRVGTGNFNVPAKYQSDSTSDLTADVKEGENSFEFTLKPK